MNTYLIKRSSFSGMSTTLFEGTYRECQTKLAALSKHYQNKWNCSVTWLKIGYELEVTDEGLGLIGDHHAIYHIIEEIES